MHQSMGALRANNPMYSTKDAGRRFYLKVRRAAVEAGMKECKTMKSLYSVANHEGRLVPSMAAHIDGVISVCDPAFEHILDKSTSNFEIKTETRRFIFCGRESVV